MTFKRKASGAMTDVAAPKRRASGAWVGVATIKRRLSGAWVTVWAAASGKTLATGGYSAGQSSPGTASVTLNSDGTVSMVDDGGGSGGSAWLSSGTPDSAGAALFEAMFTKTSGSASQVSMPAAGTWLQMNSNRTVSATATSTARSINVNVTIREILNTANTVTFTIACAASP